MDSEMYLAQSPLGLVRTSAPGYRKVDDVIYAFGNTIKVRERGEDVSESEEDENKDSEFSMMDKTTENVER